MTNTQTSKYIAYLLRHHPEAAGLFMDEHGWVGVSDLLEALNRQDFVSPDDLKEIVRTDSKQRYAFSDDGTRIRANQGHSIPVDVELEEKDPPEILYHGTGQKFIESINEQGLIPKSRLYVHLSSDYQTAAAVGSRHGKPHVYLVHAGAMHKAGYKFFLSKNGVWLTRTVPVQYLEYSSDIMQ